MNDDIEFLICDTALLWRRLLNSQSKLIGISNIERRIIINVERLPGATQIEIANLLEIEPQNLIRPLDKLVADNLIEKRPDSKDRRSNSLFITQKCRTILTKIYKMMDTLRPIALANISTEEIKQLKENLLKIKGNLESHLTLSEV
jgi:MarR family transcriptional regulator for hemolysin